MRAIMLLVLAAQLLDIALAPRLKVIHGISHSSIYFRTSFDQPPKEVTWKHETQGNVMQIAKIQNGLMIDEPNSRLTVGRNGRDLSIHNVTKHDNGKYIAEATLADNRIVNQTFYLTVHEPVPPPRIILEVMKIGDQCDITVHCFVPSNASDLSYSWKYKDQDSDYENIDNTGSTIQTILPLDHKDREFVCIVDNPADQKNFSVIVEQCSEKVKTRSRMPIIFSVIVVAAVMLWMYLNRSGQGVTKDKSPIQDSESTFNCVAHGKANMKPKEADVELVY